MRRGQEDRSDESSVDKNRVKLSAWMGSHYLTPRSVNDIPDSSDYFKTGQKSDFYKKLLLF